MEYAFEDLEKADLVIDAIYKGGSAPNMSAEPFHKLLPNCENSGGFRKVLRKDGSGKYAYVVLYTSMEELEWTDYLDEETGAFRYYGDNREPGRELTDTKKKGNKVEGVLGSTDDCTAEFNQTFTSDGGIIEFTPEEKNDIQNSLNEIGNLQKENNICIIITAIDIV